ARDQGVVDGSRQPPARTALRDRHRLEPRVGAQRLDDLGDELVHGARSSATGLSTHGRMTATFEWSTRGRGIARSLDELARASRSFWPWPRAHSGSGPSSGKPVKN